MLKVQDIHDELMDEIKWLQAQIEDACQVFDHYDLPEHAFHYRRELVRRSATKGMETET